MKTKHEAVWDWLQSCPYVKNLYFNFSDAKNGDTILAPDTGYKDDWLNEYIDGSGEKRYSFSVSQYLPCSVTPNSTENIEILKSFINIAEWVDKQGEVEKYPDFGCDIFSLFVAPSETGYITGSDENGVKYMLEIIIDYYEEGVKQ